MHWLRVLLYIRTHSYNMCVRVTVGCAACFRKNIPSFQPFVHSSCIMCLPFASTNLIGVHGAKKIKEENCKSLSGVFHTGSGVHLRVCRQNKNSRDFSTAYGQLPIHPPKHGLPANCAIDRWPWLSRVSVLEASVPCTLVCSCSCKTCRVLDGLAAAVHHNGRSPDVF